MSKYITKKRMKEAGIAGHVNIPYGTEVEEVDGLIIYKGAAVCAITSRNAHLHFAKNDDGKGLERGALTLAITFRLENGTRGIKAAGIWCGRIPCARSTDARSMRTFSCGDMRSTRPRWRICGTLPP